MTKFTTTPWRTHTDLLQVRAQLYPNKHPDPQIPNPPDSRQKAIARITAWKLRSNLPHAVESTALLTDALLHHSSSLNHGQNSPYSIRATYTTALTRFITGFCDIGRHRERALEPSSMLAIAKQIGLPAEFVALRHEIVHEEMPALRRLVGAAEGGLEWLWEVYWSRLDDGALGSGVDEEAAGDVKGEVMRVLREWRRRRRDALRGGNLEGGEEDAARTCEVVVEVCGACKDRAAIVAGALVRERLLLPANREFGSSLDGAFMIWDDLLLELSRRLPRFADRLITALLEAVSEISVVDPERDGDKEALWMWLMHVLKKRSGALDTRRRFEVVLEQCCLFPGYWSQRIGQEVLQIGDDDLRSDWEDLLNASAIVQTERTAEIAVTEASLSNLEHTLEGVGPMMAAVTEGRGWSRAVLSPTTPLGVVR